MAFINLFMQAHARNKIGHTRFWSETAIFERVHWREIHSVSQGNPEGQYQRATVHRNFNGNGVSRSWVKAGSKAILGNSPDIVVLSTAKSGCLPHAPVAHYRLFRGYCTVCSWNQQCCHKLCPLLSQAQIWCVPFSKYAMLSWILHVCLMHDSTMLNHP